MKLKAKDFNCFYLGLLFFSISCSTTKVDKIELALFELKAQVHNLENSQVQENKKQSSAVAEKQLHFAQTNTKLESINQEIQTIKGDLDLLKEGVRKGELPGDENNLSSPAQRITAIDEQILRLKTAQAEILKILEKQSQARNAALRKKQKPQLKKLRSVREVQKHLKQVDILKFYKTLKD